MSGKIGGASFSVLLVDGYDFLATKVKTFSHKVESLLEESDGLGDAIEAKLPTGLQKVTLSQGAAANEPARRVRVRRQRHREDFRRRPGRLRDRVRGPRPGRRADEGQRRLSGQRAPRSGRHPPALGCEDDQLEHEDGRAERRLHAEHRAAGHSDHVEHRGEPERRHNAGPAWPDIGRHHPDFRRGDELADYQRRAHGHRHQPDTVLGSGQRDDARHRRIVRPIELAQRRRRLP
jgi:hypothetical protein